MSDFASQQLSRVLMGCSNFLATPYEQNFSPEKFVEFARNNWSVVFGICAVYAVFIIVGPMVMNSRPAFDLKFALASWNAFLCVFSFIGMFRTMPYLLASVLSNPYEATICTNPTESYGSGPCGFWVMLFIFSKVPELVDTIFIVIRKKRLIFLHWYHHLTVLLFCWNSYATMAGSGLYFVAMNYSVHALMYGYYCLQALNALPKSFPAVLITISQIAQMFIGTGVCISAWYYMLMGRECSNDRSNLIAGALMYGSYLYLFVDFFIVRYTPPKGKSKGKAMKKIE